MLDPTFLTIGVLGALIAGLGYMVWKRNRCPNCGNQMHRVIGSNIWMCESRECGYSEVRGHG